MENISVLKVERKQLKNLLAQTAQIRLPQVIAFVLLFTFSRANFFGVLHPFSTAFYVSLGLSGVSKIIAILAISVGNFIFNGFSEAIQQLFSLILFEALYYIIYVVGTKKATIQSKALLMANTIGGIGVLGAMLRGLDLFNLVVALLSGLMVFSLSIAIAPASISFSEGYSNNVKVFDSKLIIAKSILISIGIISLQGVSIWGLQLATIFAALAIMVVAARKGSAMGAMAGAVLGIIIALMDFPGALDVPGMFALAGAAAGIGTKRCRTSAILWTIAILIFSGLSVLEGYLTLQYYEALAAGIIFLILPNAVVNFLSDELAGLRVTENSAQYEAGKTYEAADKIFVLGKSLSRVSRSIEENLLESEDKNYSVVQWIIESVAEKVCSQCSMCDRCWNTYLFKTYKMVEEYLSDMKVDENGNPEIPKWFSSICKKSNKFFEALNMAHSIYKVDKVWRVKLQESRILLSQQAAIISAGIMNIARNLNNLSERDTEAEYCLGSVAENRKMPVSGFRCHTSNSARPSVEVIYEGKNKLDFEELDEIVQENVNGNLVRVGQCRRDMMGYSVIKYMKKPRFNTVTGVSRNSKDEDKVSGDSFAFFVSNNCYQISAISDGMGSGKHAEKYSKTAIQVFENLIEDGVDVNLAVRFINLYLNMKGNDNRLATIDICAIDLYNGEASFYKYDAPPAVVKKRHETIIVDTEQSNDSKEDSDTIHYKSMQLSAGDFLILISDGVLEAFSIAGETNALQAFINAQDTINPQQMADLILEEAMRKSDGRHDDLTILVTKLW